MAKILSTNQLANSAHYPKILEEYNIRYAASGKVNSKKFFEEIIAPLLPEYKLRSWYKFLERFATAADLMATVAPVPPPVLAAPQERILLSNAAATSKLVTHLLNVSAARAAELAEHPEMLTHKEALEIGLKTMKAQDSRIHAIGKIREDSREQEKFDRAFSGAASE